MNQAARETVDVQQLWQKKAEALHAIYLLTLEQSKACAAEDIKRLNELIEQRQNWMDRADALDAWLSDLGAKENAPQAELAELIKKIQQVDAYNQRIAAEKLEGIRDGIRSNNRMRQGMRSYIRAGALADGMYFDTKK